MSFRLHPPIFGALALLFMTQALAPAAPFKEATVTRTHNQVYLIDAAKQVAPARPSDKMDASMVLATGAESRAELQFPDQTLARIGSNSYFSFSEGTRDMELGKGTMLLKVPKNLGGAKITTQAVTAAITGTTVLLESNPGPVPVFLSGITVPTLPGIAATASVPTSPLDGTYKEKGKTTAIAREVEGNCRILRPGTSQSVALNPGDPVPVGSYVMTDGGGSALISPMPGVAVTIDNGTSARLETLTSSAESTSRKPEIHFDLKKGALHTAIACGSGEPVDFKIRTPQGVAAARGTVTSTSTDGQTSQTFSIHGTVVWIYPNNQEQPIAPGSLIPFTGQGGQVVMGSPIPPNDPQFQRFLRRAITLVNRAADAGLIRPDLPVAVLQTARQKNVPLTPEQESGLRQPREQGGTTGQPPSGAQQPPASGEGYSKLVVLEGNMRVFLNNRVGESTVLRPGQMIILNPYATRLPEPVNVRIDRILNTSKLIGGFEETGDGTDPLPLSRTRAALPGADATFQSFIEGMSDAQREQFSQLTPEEQKRLFDRYLQNRTGTTDPILNDPKLQEAYREQQLQLNDGTFTDTNLKLVGTTIVSGDTTGTLSNRTDTTGTINPFRGRPIPYPGTFTVSSASGVSTNPRLVDSLTSPVETINGNIYYPKLDGSFSDWAAGSTNLLDQLAEVSSPFGPGELVAGFKADQFRIGGNPAVAVGSVFTGTETIPVNRLAFIGVNSITFPGAPIFTELNGGFDKLGLLLFATEDGPINASGTTFNLPNLGTLAFYAREADPTTIGLNGGTATSSSNLNLDNINFTGNGLDGIAGRSLEFSGATVNASDYVELNAGHRITLNSNINTGHFDADSLLLTEMAGGSISAFQVNLGSEETVSITAGLIRTEGLDIYAGDDATPITGGQGYISLNPSVIDGTNLQWANIIATDQIDILGNFGFASAPYTRIGVGDGGTINVYGYLKSVDNLFGGIGSSIFIDNALQARFVDVDALFMAGGDPIFPFLVDPFDPNRFHDWNIGSFEGNLNPFYFFGLDGFDGRNGGTGGELDLSSSGDLVFGSSAFAPTGFGNAFFTGGNATDPLGDGGDGGLLFLTADNDLLIYNTTIDAGTGTNGSSTIDGGQGGELDFSSGGKTVIDHSLLQVSSNTTGRKSEGGGRVLIESNYSRPLTSPNDPAISIQNSSEILGLLDAGVTGRGSHIVIQSNSRRGDIVIDNSWVEAGGNPTQQGIVEIFNNADNSSIDIAGSTIKANSVHIMSNFTGGTINIRSGSTISATNLLRIATGFDSTNMVRFSGGGTIQLQGNPIEIAGHTVQIDNGTSVNNSGNTNVTANNHKYNTGGFGSFTNPVNQLTP